MGAGAGLEIARNGSPDGAAQGGADQSQRQVDDGGQALKSKSDEGADNGADIKLAFNANVKQSGFETHRHGQAEKNVR